MADDDMTLDELKARAQALDAERKEIQQQISGRSPLVETLAEQFNKFADHTRDEVEEFVKGFCTLLKKDVFESNTENTKVFMSAINKAHERIVELQTEIDELKANKKRGFFG